MHNMETLCANKILALSVLLQDSVAAANKGLSASAVAALLTLKYRSHATATGLMSILDLSQPATTRLLEALERKGLVAKEGRAGRTVPFILTAEGRRLARRLEEKRLAVAKAALSGLLNHEKRALDRMLTKVLGREDRSRAEARRLCRFCEHGVCKGAICPIGSSVVEEERSDADRT